MGRKEDPARASHEGWEVGSQLVEWKFGIPNWLQRKHCCDDSSGFVSGCRNKPLIHLIK